MVPNTCTPSSFACGLHKHVHRKGSCGKHLARQDMPKLAVVAELIYSCGTCCSTIECIRQQPSTLICPPFINRVSSVQPFSPRQALTRSSTVCQADYKLFCQSLTRDHSNRKTDTQLGVRHMRPPCQAVPQVDQSTSALLTHTLTHLPAIQCNAADRKGC
jgi:hypothetical protein